MSFFGPRQEQNASLRCAAPAFCDSETANSLLLVQGFVENVLRRTHLKNNSLFECLFL